MTGLGALVGSFLNVVVYRVPRGESVVKPRSRCPGCETPISPRDNVPVLSWLALRGRCRRCGEQISARYPATEAVTAVTFALVVLVEGVGKELLLSLPFAAMLIAVASVDLEHRIIPNRVLLPAAVWGLTAGCLIDLDAMPERLAAAAGAFTFLLVAALVYPGGMGMGDVKLAGLMGLYLGVSVVPALMVAFLAGTLVGAAIMLRHGSEARKRAVPFAPFLALGGLVGLLAGSELIELYADRFLS